MECLDATRIGCVRIIILLVNMQRKNTDEGKYQDWMGYYLVQLKLL